MDISESVNVEALDEEMEPFLVESATLAQKRRSQGRIIFDRFIRNRTAVGAACFLIIMIVFCFVGPESQRDAGPAEPGPSIWH